MKCSVATNINARKIDKHANEFGAKIITNLAKVKINHTNLTEVVSLPTKSALMQENSFVKGASYIFSNPGRTTPYGLNNVIDIEDKKSLNRLVSAGSNLYKGISETYFNSRANTVINPIPNKAVQVIVEGDFSTSVKGSDSRGFIRVDSDDIITFRKLISSEMSGIPLKADGQDHSADMEALYDEGLEFLLISALYRGYNIVLDAPIKGDIVNKALNKYNKHLKPGHIKTQFVSPFRVGENVVRTLNLNAYVNTLDLDIRPTKKKVNSSNNILSYYLSDQERTTYNVYKKASRASKANISRRVAKVFNRTIKGIDMQVMDSGEIVDLYGDVFKDKKGFIIGGKVILNSDNMTADTVFHEFNHFYMKWLEKHNGEAYAQLLRMVETEYASDIASYTSIYKDTGIEHSDSDILVEIFSDKMGILAANELESVLEESDETIGETIENYTSDFLKKLTRNDLITPAEADFGLMTSISEMFNIGLMHVGEFENSPLLEGDNTDILKALSEFTLEQPNAKELFNSLIARGLVTEIKKDTIILTDTSGNRYNTKGEIDPEASYKYYKWDTPAHVRSNQRFLEDAHNFLDRFKNEAQVFFSASTNPSVTSIVNKIKNNSENVKLNSEGTAYVLKGPDGSEIELRRTTQFLGDTFGSGAKGEEFAISHIWSKKINEYKEQVASDEDTEEEKDKEAIEYAQNYIENEPHFKTEFDDVMRIFEFKADEGTFLHDLAEFYFRTLQYSNEIDFGSDRKGGYMHFAKPIIEKVAIGGPEFSSYIDSNFIAKLQDKAGTHEYSEYIRVYQKLKEALVSNDRTALHIQSFLKMLNTTVIPVISALPGPVTILPEVQLASKTLGVAGKLDLVVVDGKGRAHIFDYKTKTIGREFWWDYNSPAKMKGVMGDYSDNAMMKASVQTSIYKLILMEMGIDVAPSNIFYVENTVIGRQLAGDEKVDDIYFDKNKMEYSPERIVRKPVLDVSAEMVMHFSKEEERGLDFIDTTDKSSALKDVMLKASGGFDIDRANTIREDAERIYDRALVQGISESNKKLAEIMAKFVNSKSKKGLVVTLIGGTKFELPAKASKEESIALIENAIKEKKAVKNIEAEFINRFNSLDRGKSVASASERSTDRDLAYRSLLVDVDSTSHEITKMSSDINYGADSSGILFIKNKITKGTRVVILNHDLPKNIDFGNDRSNIFGNFISDNKARMLNPRGSMKANNYNMRLIKMGITMAQQKLVNSDFNVEVIVSNSKFSSRTVPNVHDISVILKAAKDMLEVMKESGEELPNSIAELLKHPHLFESTSYQQNPIDSLTEYLNIATGSLVNDNDFFNNNKKAGDRRLALKNILNTDTGFRNTQEILEALREFRHSLSTSRSRSLEAKIHDDLWTLTDQVIMFLHGFNYLVSPKNTDMVDNFLMTTSKTANMYQTYFNRKITESTTDIREDFIEYKKEHNKLIEAIALSKGVSLGAFGSALYTTSRKRIFDNLFAYDNDGKRKNAFKLRDPGRPTKITSAGQTTLNRAEIAYLKFFRENAQQFSTMSVVGRSPVIPAGWMPLMRKSNLSNRLDMSVYDRAKASLEKAKKGISPSTTKKSDTPIEEEFTLENKFKGQIPVEASKEEENWTRARQEALGIDETGEIVDKEVDVSLIEDNLENVLDSFAVASLEAFHYRDVSEFGKSLFYNVKRFENLSGGTSYDQIIKTISLIQKRVIKHQQDTDDSPVLNAVNSLATSVVTMGTVTQALLETFTNPLVTTSTYVADKMYGVMFNGTREFSAKNFAKATTMIWQPGGKYKPVIEAIDQLYGMTNMDTRNLKEMLNTLEANSALQSKHLMFINKIMLENWQKITMVAYMLEQGTFYAHSVDSNGILTYDEREDTRFNGIGESLKTQADKKEKYIATKLQLMKQRNGLTGTTDDEFETRKLKRAWTTYDVNYVKELIVEAYSSMDESSKSLATFYAISGAFFKMRTWLFPKIPRYFQKPMSADENSGVSKLQKVEDESTPLGYRYEWKGTESEGIMYTLEYLMRNAGEQKHWIFSKGAWKFKNENQKKNMSKLLADVSVISFILAGVNGIWAYALDDEMREDETAQLIKNRMTMAASDVFLLKSLLDITTGNGSLFISGAIAVRAVSSVLRAAALTPQALYNDEVGVEEIGAAYSEIGKNTIGLYKTMQMASTAITDDE